MKIRFLFAVVLVLAASPLHADELKDLLDHFSEQHEQRMKTDPAYRHKFQGDEFAKKKQYGKAAGEYQQAVRHAPKNAALRAKLGHALVSSRRPREGLSEAEKAIAMSSGKEPWLYSALLTKGVAHGMLGNMDAAIEALNRSIALKPTVLGHITRASAYAQSQKLDAALGDCDAALKLKPENAKLWTFKAQLHMMSAARGSGTGHKDKACHAMRKACEFGECRPLKEFTECKAE